MDNRVFFCQSLIAVNELFLHFSAAELVFCSNIGLVCFLAELRLHVPVDLAYYFLGNLCTPGYDDDIYLVGPLL